MTPEDLIAAFVDAHRRIVALQGRRAYERAADLELIIEARIRIEQLRFILSRFHEAEVQHSGTHAESQDEARRTTLTPERLREIHDRLGEFGTALSLYAEAFYYFAHRATSCLEKVEGFKGFVAKGVRDVRNRLIEHPESLNRNFIIDDPRGFVLKPYSTNPKMPKDPGLYPNAEEFVVKLLERLKRVGA